MTQESSTEKIRKEMLKLPDLTNNCLLFLDMSENSLVFKTYEQTY